MNSQRLWAPWRIKYLKDKKKKKCIFCAAKKKSSGDYLIFRTRYSLIMLNIYPYNNGHVMVSPLRHVNDLDHLSDQEALDIFRSINRAKKLLCKVLKPDGFNIGLNISKSAGAGFAGHLHIHVVPRWLGDTNFMTAVSGTKIVSQSLKELQKLLKDAHAKTN